MENMDCHIRKERRGRFHCVANGIADPFIVLRLVVLASANDCSNHGEVGRQVGRHDRHHVVLVYSGLYHGFGSWILNRWSEQRSVWSPPLPVRPINTSLELTTESKDRLFGEVTAAVGMLVAATAKSPEQLTAGLAIAGFGGGFCQMAMCSIPELMPNKYRHIGIAISDGFVFVIVVIGPVVGRYAIDSGDHWRFIYYGILLLIPFTVTEEQLLMNHAPRGFDCPGHLTDLSVRPVSSPEAPERGSVERRHQRAGLCRHHPSCSRSMSGVGRNNQHDGKFSIQILVDNAGWH